MVRKLIYSFGVSLDGFIAGPDGEIDWAAPDEELHRFHNQQAREVGMHLYGRRLYGDYGLVSPDSSEPYPTYYASKLMAMFTAGGDQVVQATSNYKFLAPYAAMRADGSLAGIYKVLSCPQVSFAYPGGKVQSPALLSTPTPPTLRSRVGALVAAAKARGWREPSR